MSVSERTTNDAADHTQAPCVTPFQFITKKKLEKFLKVVAASQIQREYIVYIIQNTFSECVECVVCQRESFNCCLYVRV